GHADRRRVGEEDGEEQRQRGQRLLAAGEQRQALQLLARRARHDLEPRGQRVLALVERKMGAAAAEQRDEELAEMLVDLGEGGEQALAALMVELRDALAQAGARRRARGALGVWAGDGP